MRGARTYINTCQYKVESYAMSRLEPQASPPPLIVVFLTWNVPDTSVNALVAVLEEHFKSHNREASLHACTYSPC